MKLRVALFTVCGVALGLYLVMYVGWRAVLSAAIAIGWGGFALFCLCALGLFLILGMAWYVLLPREVRVPVRGPWCARAWCGFGRGSAALLTPGRHRDRRAGGDRVGFPALACASMIVDVTVELPAQITATSRSGPLRASARRATRSHR
jgi:hypothetical protein